VLVTTDREYLHLIDQRLAAIIQEVTELHEHLTRVSQGMGDDDEGTAGDRELRVPKPTPVSPAAQVPR
jgi:hypothetical protein